METDLKKMDVEELLVIVWDNGAGDGYRGIQTRDVAAELIRRTTEANARADQLAAEVRAMLAARAFDRWIPVEESLPALQVPVLVTCRCYREVLRCYLAPSGRWHLNASTSFAPEFILAWKALPKGYLGERRAGTPAPPVPCPPKKLEPSHEEADKREGTGGPTRTPEVSDRVPPHRDQERGGEDLEDR
jgi:hypothetical protein